MDDEEQRCFDTKALDPTTFCAGSFKPRGGFEALYHRKMQPRQPLYCMHHENCHFAELHPYRTCGLPEIASSARYIIYRYQLSPRISVPACTKQALARHARRSLTLEEDVRNAATNAMLMRPHQTAPQQVPHAILVYKFSRSQVDAGLLPLHYRTVAR